VNTLMHYAIATNFFWLLVEGMYLKFILAYTFTTNEKIIFRAFVLFGWGAPCIPMAVWIFLRWNLETEDCWNTGSTTAITWTEDGPIILVLLANFAIFLNILCVIYVKLKANNIPQSDYKLKLAKSTLSLIPLLGIHHVLFMALTRSFSDPNNFSHLILNAFDTLIVSLQGTLLSLLYCFTTEDVKLELSKLLKKAKQKLSFCCLPEKQSHHSKGEALPLNDAIL